MKLFLIKIWIRYIRLFLSRLKINYLDKKYKINDIPNLYINMQENTIEKIINRFKHVMTKIPYKETKKFGILSSPEKIWIKNLGNSYDLAILSMELFEKIKYKVPFIGKSFIIFLAGTPIKNSHSICVTSINNVLSVIDNGSFIKKNFSTIDEVIKFYSKKLFKKECFYQIIDKNLKEIEFNYIKKT